MNHIFYIFLKSLFFWWQTYLDDFIKPSMFLKKQNVNVNVEKICHFSVKYILIPPKIS